MNAPDQNPRSQSPWRSRPDGLGLTATQKNVRFEDMACLFEVGDRRYAVASHQIAQVLEVDGLERLPMSPKYLLGVTFTENALLPVISLHDEPALRDRLLVAILVQGDSKVGVAIDRALGFRELKGEAPQLSGSQSSVPRPPFVDSVRMDGNEEVQVLSVAQVMERFRPTLAEPT